MSVSSTRVITKATRPGDTLQVSFTCKQKVNREEAEYGEVRWDLNVTNQDGESVAAYDVLTMVAKKNPPA